MAFRAACNETVMQECAGFCITPQVLAKLYAVVTPQASRASEVARGGPQRHRRLPRHAGDVIAFDTAGYSIPLDGAGSPL